MKYIIILRYYMPQYKDDHYIVIKEINDKFIYFYDSIYGENQMDIVNLNNLWHTDNGHGNQPGWMIGIRKDKGIDMKDTSVNISE